MFYNPGIEEKVIVWFSCGAASAVAAHIAVKHFKNVRVVNNPVAEEDEDNRRFLNDVQEWLGVEIETATNPKYPSNSCVDVWDDRNFMSGPQGAPCTGELKKKARAIWEEENNEQFTPIILGFTKDENKRAEDFQLRNNKYLYPILIDHGLTKSDCYLYLQDHNIKRPNIYNLGYPNANCIGCVKATSPTYWNHVRKKHPDVFKERVEQSERIGAKLARVNSKRIPLSQLKETDQGAPLKNIDFECGIFCR